MSVPLILCYPLLLRFVRRADVFTENLFTIRGLEDFISAHHP